jgi:hypothetical protein
VKSCLHRSIVDVTTAAAMDTLPEWLSVREMYSPGQGLYDYSVQFI